MDESRARWMAALFAFGPILLFVSAVVLAAWWDGRRKRRATAKPPEGALAPVAAEPPHPLVRAVFWGLMGFLFLGLICVWFDESVERGATFLPGLRVGLVLWLAWGVASVSMWRARRHRSGRVGPGVALVGGGALGLFLMVIAGGGLVSLVNVALDSGPPAAFQMVVTTKWQVRSGRWVTYFIALRSTDPPRVLPELRVSRERFDAVEPDRTRLRLRTKPGALGLEHVVELVPDP